MDISQVVYVNDILVKERIRQDYGDVTALAASIKEFGVIQPIVITTFKENDLDIISLVAGGRRLKALKSLGKTELRHGIEFIWSTELQNTPSEGFDYRKQSIEMEENLKRKDLSWQEQVLGKQRLLLLMQEIHGLPMQGRPSESQKASNQPGFGVRKLAIMLGESVAQTSEDLNLAALIEKIPSLKSEANREDAKRKFTSEAIKALIAIKGKSTIVDSSFATTYHGSFMDNIQSVANESVDLIYTDLPYGVNLDDMDKHQSTELDYDDTRQVIVGTLENLARESYRILKPDRFAVFWFGFNYYQELLDSFKLYGFEVNPVPFVWYKKTGSTQLPLLLYANAYEQALVIRKGVPRLIR